MCNGMNPSSRSREMYKSTKCRLLHHPLSESSPPPSVHNKCHSHEISILKAPNLFLLSLLLSLLTLPCVVVSQSSQSGSQCPSMCNCIWRNGKQTAICESQGLISIPSGILSTTQVLNLNRNNFQILPTRVFQERGLSNLQKVFLAECKLGVIAPDAFVQLTNLVELYLSGNLLTTIPKESFQSTPSLRKLDLHSNPISLVKRGSFEDLSNLNTLDLSYCQIDAVEPGSFSGLNKLQYLKLESNRLTTLSHGVVSDLPSLYSLDLHANPWNCDCNLRSGREWMIRVGVPQSIPPTCASPTKLSGMMWNSLELDEFACTPVIVTRDLEGASVHGSSVNFTCSVKSQPEAKISWLIDGVIYRNTSTTPGITFTAISTSNSLPNDPSSGNFGNSPSSSNVGNSPSSGNNNFGNDPSTYGSSNLGNYPSSVAYQVSNQAPNSQNAGNPFPVIMRSSPNQYSENVRDTPTPRVIFIEERSPSTPSTGTPSMIVSSTLIYNHVESSDAGKTFICYAENSAGVTSKNFTLTYVASNSSTLTSYTSWSKMETGALIGSLAAIVLAVSVLLVYFSKKSNLGRSKSDANSGGKPNLFKNISSPLGVVKMNGNVQKSYGARADHDGDAKVINGGDAMMLMKIRPETGNSSGYGSTQDGTTPDLTSSVLNGIAHAHTLRNGGLASAHHHFLNANQINQYQHFNQGFASDANMTSMLSNGQTLTYENNGQTITYNGQQLGNGPFIDASGNVILSDSQLTPGGVYVSGGPSYMYDNEGMYDASCNDLDTVPQMMQTPNGLLQPADGVCYHSDANTIQVGGANTIQVGGANNYWNENGVDPSEGPIPNYNYVNYYDGVPNEGGDANFQSASAYYDGVPNHIMMNAQSGVPMANYNGGTSSITPSSSSLSVNANQGPITNHQTLLNQTLTNQQGTPTILLANGQYVNASTSDGSDLIGTVI